MHFSSFLLKRISLHLLQISSPGVTSRHPILAVAVGNAVRSTLALVHLKIQPRRLRIAIYPQHGYLVVRGETLPSLIHDSSFGPTILGIKHGIEADFKQSGFQPLFTGKPFNHNMQRSPVQSGKSNCSLNTNCSSLSPATNNRCQ